MSAKATVFASSDVAALEKCLAEIDSCAAALEKVPARRRAAAELAAIEASVTSQALALDALFYLFGRKAAQGGLFPAPMQKALRAQSQCRATAKNLIGFKKFRASQDSRKRTIGDRKNQACPTT